MQELHILREHRKIYNKYIKNNNNKKTQKQFLACLH